MRAMKCMLLLTVGASAFSGTPARAGVVFYDIFYSVFYEQNTPAAPTEYYGTNFAARVIADPGDVSSASFTPPDAVAMGLPEIAPGYFLHQYNFATEEEVLGLYGPGQYNFAIDGGTLGNREGSIERPLDALWCPEIPAFTESSMADMQVVDADADFTPSFSTFAMQPGANTAVTFFSVFDSTDAFVFGTHFSSDVGSVLIPAGTLRPGASYHAILFFSSRIESPTEDMGGSTKIVGFDRVTAAPLVTRSRCVGDLNNDSFVDDSDFVLFVSAYNVLDCADPAMPPGCPADFTRDGFVDDSDFVLFVSAYNELVCP